MASCEKKRRVDSTEDDDFSEYSKELIIRLADTLQKLITWASTHLTAQKIENCNAADSSCGVSFSKAYCPTIKEPSKMFAFGDIFERGLDILMAFIDKRTLPSNKQEKYILSKLLRYMDKDEQFPTDSLDELSETELTTLLANHLFGQLATSPHYTIDKNCAGKRKKDQCLCGRKDCKLTGNFGDTSIGNEEVWHGKLDIIINNDLVVEPVERKEVSPGGKSPVEVKLKSTELSRNAQIIAETIVFSFLQKQRHPEKDHFLFPCIGIGSSEMVIMFYDSQHDVLLESSRIPLLDQSEGEKESEKISSTAVLISWLVVNYKYLCTGLTDHMKNYKADFFTIAKEKLEIYEKYLKFGGVGISFVLEKTVPGKIVMPRNPSMIERSKKMTEIYFRLVDENPGTSKI